MLAATAKISPKPKGATPTADKWRAAALGLCALALENTLAGQGVLIIVAMTGLNGLPTQPLKIRPQKGFFELASQFAENSAQTLLEGVTLPF